MIPPTGPGLGYGSGTNYYILPEPYKTDGSVMATERQLFGQCSELIQQGRNFLRMQPAYPYIQTGLDLINGTVTDKTLQSLSDAKMEQTVRNAKELIAAQTNIRIIPTFKTEIHQFDDQCETLNKSFMAWQGMTFADRQLRKAWQYACIAGTGYLGTRYEPNYYYNGKGDIVWDAYGPLDVMPIGLPHDMDIQKAYCVIVKIATPIHEAFQLFPTSRDILKPSGDSKVRGFGAVVAAGVKYASSVLGKYGPNAVNEQQPVAWPTVDIYYLYVRDMSVNNTGGVIPMGEPGTTWYYEVPYMGMDIKVGESADGSPIFRKAVEKDCLLYPNRRLIKMTDYGIINPDPMMQVSPYWHGKVPLVQLRADDWAWNYLGFPVTRAGANLEKAANNLLRGVIDSGNARLSPPRGFDKTTMSAATASAINPRIPNTVVGIDPTFAAINDQMKPLLDHQFYDVPPFITELIQNLQGMGTHQMGVADAQALTRARQLPAGDSVDKLMEVMGPLVKDQSRNMEESIRGLGEQWKSCFFQFYRAKRRMELTGPDSIHSEDFDLDYDSMIPSEERMWGATASNGTSSGLSATVFQSQIARARWHKDFFTFSVAPYSLHELNSITRKLFHLQLSRAGFPIDWWTLAEVFDIKNFGPVPYVKDKLDDHMRPAKDIMERYIAQKEIEVRIQAGLQQAIQQFGGSGGGAGAGAGATIGTKPTGRPPSGQQPPVLEQRSGEGGTRAVIRESPR